MILVATLAFWLAATAAAVYSTDRPGLLPVQIVCSCASIVAMGAIPVAMLTSS